VAEEALARGARVRLCLALPVEEFEVRSVALPGTDWSARFRRLLRIAEVEVLNGGAASDGVFGQTNKRLIEVARSLDATPHVIVVWNGRGGDGPGGTSDLVSRLGLTGPDPRIRVIDPTRRAYEARQAPDGPKRMLAVDGGGIRGALSLAILASLEARLRKFYGRDLVLADFFDYVGGTSTGAIIAAGLARGSEVGELQALYRTLGAGIFTKRFLPMQFRSRYRDDTLTRELVAFFGEYCTLGDPRLRCLLLLVLHNATTDSVWPLSNCTQAKYNRADRCLNRPPDRNLDLPLTALIRGSAAAPVFFPPQELRVGARRFVFEDGGVTPFNNPALLLFMLATLPEYGLSWPPGEQALLVVSIGSGAAATVHPGLVARSAGLVFQARNLPSVFMNGASVGQDLLCRALGHCRVGAPIDREVGNRLDVTGVGGRSLFTYIRYNADLSDEGLAARGVASLRERRRLRKLDAVSSLPTLERLGRTVGESIDLEGHLSGFL
jgi:hypothetical protein